MYTKYRSQVVPEIKIQTRSIEEYFKVESHLKKISQGPNGRELLFRIKALSTRGKHTLICTVDTPSSIGAMLTREQIYRHGVSSNPDDPVHSQLMLSLARIRPDWTNNEGVVGIVKLNLQQGIELDKYGFPTGKLNNKEHNFISLAHELVHSYNLMNGTFYGGHSVEMFKQQHSAMRHEEDRAVGIGRYRGFPVSENGVRMDHNIPLRTNYFTKDYLNRHNLI